MPAIETNLKSEWDHFFAIVNTDTDWITPLMGAIDGVTPGQAFWKPGPNVASIAEIALHANGWLETTLREILGAPFQDNVDWPTAPAPSEASWESIAARLRSTVGDLSRALHNLELEELLSNPPGSSESRSSALTSILVHNAYHSGQIVKLRQSHDAIVAAA